MLLEEAISLIQQNAIQHRGKYPTLSTLLKEVAELAASLEGKHEHHPTLELTQIGGIVANLLARYPHTDAVAAIRERYEGDNAH